MNKPRLFIEMTSHMSKRENNYNSKKLIVENITFQKYDSPSQNGVLYPKNLVEYAINKQVMPRIKANNFIGELDHKSVIESNNDNMLPIPRLEYASHLITHIELDQNTKSVRGTLRLLSTSMGQILKTLLEEGVTVGISLRAVSQSTEQKDGLVIPNDLILLSYDAVTLPGFGLENVSFNKENLKVVSEVLQHFANKKNISTEQIENLAQLYNEMSKIFEE